MNYWLLVTRLPQRLSQGVDSNIGYLSQGCHKVCHKVFVQLLVICHKVATIFTTRFGSIIGYLPQCLSQGFGPNLLFATRLSQCLSQSFGSIIGYLSQGYHTVCHNVLVQLLVTCHKVTTMFVTRFWFNYWLFDTQLPQCLSQDFGSIVGHLPQGYHNVCHKLLVQLLVICHKISTMFVTRFYVQLLLLQGYHNACHKVLVRLFGYLPQGFDSIIGHLLHGCHEVLVQLLVTCHKVATKLS